MKAKWFVNVIFLAFFYGLSFSMAAEPSYPIKPIEMIVGLAPGGGTDLAIRMLGETSKKYLGQELVVINKPGGGGRLTASLITKAKPDGYTLAAVTNSPINVIPLLEKVPYKLEDFTFIIQYGVMDYLFAVLSDSPFKTFQDTIEFARANPNKLTVGTVGVGTTNHVVLEAIMLRENIKINLVPYNSAGEAATALLGGHVMVAGTGTSGVAPHLKAKTVRLLAMISDKRTYAHPEVPTLKELGYTDLAFESWYIICGPKNMDKVIVNKVEGAFRKGMESPEYIKLVQDLELWEKNPLSGDELREGVIQRYIKNGEIFKRIGMAIK